MNRKSFVFVLLAVLMASIVQADYVYRIVPYNTGIGLPVSDEAYTFESVSYLNSTWLYFDGINDNVTINADADMNNTNKGSLSVMAWGLYPMLKTPNSYILVGKGTTNDYEFDLKLGTANVTTFTISNTVANAYSSSSGSVKTTRNTWNHYGGSFNGSGTKTYLNGIFDGQSSTITGDRETQGLAPLQIGTRNVVTSTNRHWNGSIDEVRVYNRSIETWEFKAAYNESRHGRNKGLRIPVLSYHQIRSGRSTSSTIVSNANFSAQMLYLYANGFQSITLRDYYLWTQNQYRMPDKPVIITFDDGYLSTYVNASPIMATYGFTGSVAIESSNAAAGNPNYMTWAQINQLEALGWEMLSHGVNATPLTQLPNSATRISVFSKSKNYIIGNTSITPLTFVYPSHLHNSTIDAECALYYTMCTGLGSGNTAPVFAYKSSDLTGGVDRLLVLNNTDLETFKRNVNRDYGLVLQYDLDENNGTAVYDVGLYQKNGVINGALWRSDGVNRTLVPGYEWNVNGPTFIQYNPYLEYNWMKINYHQKTGSEIATEAALKTAEGLSRVLIGIASLLTILGLAVLGGLFATKKIDMNVLIVGGLALVGALLMAVVGVIFMMGVSG